MNNSSISLDAPVGIFLGSYSGNSGNNSATYGYTNTGQDFGLIFGYEVPLAVDFNIGCNSTSSNADGFGGFFGVGYDYSQFSIFASKYSNYHAVSIGPLIRGGFRFAAGGSKSVSIGLFYKKGREVEQFKTFGVTLLADF